MKITIAVPSFIKLSPSINVAKLFFAPSSFNKATTATGSVALNPVPRSRLAANVQSSYITTLIGSAVIPDASSRPGPASKRHCHAVFLNRCHSIEKADSKISGGRNT